MPRRTSDVIALMLTFAVVVVVIGTAAAILYISITHPEQDSTRAADAVGRILGVLVGAIVGYMAGRQIKNGNGTS